MELEKLLDQYVDRFEENFPIMLFRGTPEDELVRMIRICLDEGKPFEAPPLNDEFDY